MGHWGITEDPDDEGLWGDQEADVVGDYLEFLAKYDRLRLFRREQLIEEIAVKVWWVLYEDEFGRDHDRRELEYGLDFSLGPFIEDIDEVEIADPSLADNTTPVHEFWDEGLEEGLTEYFEYLEDTNPEKLQKRDTILNDIRILLEEWFADKVHRLPRNEEIEYIYDNLL